MTDPGKGQQARSVHVGAVLGPPGLESKGQRCLLWQPGKSCFGFNYLYIRLYEPMNQIKQLVLKQGRPTG
jgi:hypothetical protein